ncbi:MAG: site-specific integrase [Bacteroidetes bacterium]|nr:site-specific integrase [Bacteroidota bacterium]
MTTISIQPIFHHGEHHLLLIFPKESGLIQILRKEFPAKWSSTYKAWYIPNGKDQINHLFKAFKGLAWLDLSDLKKSDSDLQRHETGGTKSAMSESPDSTREEIKKFRNWLLSQRYSDSTVKTYCEAIAVFLRFFHEKPLARISNSDLVQFNTDYILQRKYSASYQNQVINAVKLFFRIIVNTDMNPELIHRPKRPSLLPNVLSTQEVASLLKVTENRKHKTLLSLIYSCGLRRSEILNLKPADVDSDRNLLIIRQGKGKKDRVVPLSDKTIVLLRDYFREFRPQTYLFEGQQSGEKYSEQSLRKVLESAVKKAGIKKPVTLHWLRHSYATHLLESGTDLRYIQEILGHKSSKTTEIYTHVSTLYLQKIKTPFDSLDLT